MNTYTIFVANPLRDLPFPATPNCAGQMIAFDGKCTKDDAINMARIAAQSWGKVQIFCGKNLGRIVEGWEF